MPTFASKYGALAMTEELALGLLAEAVNTDPEGVPVDVTFTRYAAGRTQLVVEGA